MAIPAINLIYIWYGHWTTQPNPLSRYHHSVWYWLNRLVALILVLPSVLRSAGLGLFHSNLKDSLSSRGQDQARTVKIRKKLHEHTPQKIWMMSHCAFHPITHQLGLFGADWTPIRWFVWYNVSWESHSFLMLSQISDAIYLFFFLVRILFGIPTGYAQNTDKRRKTRAGELHVFSIHTVTVVFDKWSF